VSTVAVSYTFTPNTLIQASQANQNFQDLTDYINGQAIVRDATVAFTAVPSGPGTDPSSDNQFTRKAYVDVPRFTAVASGLTLFNTAGVLTDLNVTWAIQSSRHTEMLVPSGVGTNGFRVQRSGILIVGASIRFATSAVGTYRNMSLLHNNVLVEGDSRGASSLTTGIGQTARVQTAIQVAANDTFEVQYEHDGPNLASVARLWATGIPGTWS
jgi:hypothetical protein